MFLRSVIWLLLALGDGYVKNSVRFLPKLDRISHRSFITKPVSRRLHPPGQPTQSGQRHLERHGSKSCAAAEQAGDTGNFGSSWPSWR
ncbi:hypothetical protein SMB34_14745 [Thalassospira permensis NBRC 106175]|uniref:Secreted protein n=1 Tax=Thalassospira permensis NBRC 106175 TaxID=1353532 RepID=A0ABR4TRF9_9PROT|nr:hypothetical protein SMB34_14745 [Thalassospira permensis NBRC 106175]